MVQKEAVMGMARRLSIWLATAFFAALLPAVDPVDNANTQPTPSFVDYSTESNWAYFGIGDKNTDLFLIAPTVYGSDVVFNMPVNDAGHRRRFTGALNMQRGIYEDSTRMFAPLYGQAAFAVYGMDEAEAERYFALAYGDVRAAFMYYMEHHNEGRPFVLAGFSQGADMALRLMKEFFGDEKVNRLLVAAYIIGWRVTPEDLAAYPFLRMAEGADDVGVIVCINTEAEFVTGSIIVPETTLGINPLNWRTDGVYAPREMNRGACFTDYDGNIAQEIPHFTGAYLDGGRGVVKVTDVSPTEYPPRIDLFEEGIYHVYDYLFFYRNLQENVALRTATHILE